MQKKIFLDRAHGINITGKCSPDGTFKEWAWSDYICNNVVSKLKLLGYNAEKYPLDVIEFTDSKGRPIISKRVEKYNSEANGLNKVYVFSIHANAVNGGWNEQVTGFEIWAQKDNHESCTIAQNIGDEFKNKYPESRLRKQINERNYKVYTDKEPKLTILEGNKNVKPLYTAVLIESKFMTAKSDLAWLNDEEEQEKYIDILVNVIIQAIKNPSSTFSRGI